MLACMAAMMAIMPLLARFARRVRADDTARGQRPAGPDAPLTW
jgi:hypothetical protein